MIDQRHLVWTRVQLAFTATLAFILLWSVVNPTPKAKESTVAFSSAHKLAEFGIIGDGIADDSDAIQNAVNSGIKDLTFPPGEYRLTRSITINLDDAGPFSIHGGGTATFHMEAAGAAFVLQGTHFRSADPGTFDDRVWQRQRMPLVDGIAIAGAHKDADGIEAIGTMQLTISRVHVRKCRHAVRLSKNNRNLIISDSHFYENSGIGVFYDNCNLHQSNIVGCHISYNGGGGIVSRAGNVRNIHISGCDIESNMGKDSESAANILIDCRNSKYGTGEVAITGCTIQHNHKAHDTANIRILGRSDSGDPHVIVREGNITITGNVLSDVDTNLHLDHCRGVTVTGNTFWMGFDRNLLVENCSSVVMSANNFDRNPRYAYGDAVTSRNSLLFNKCNDCTITGLHCTNIHGESAAVTIKDSTRMNISNCTILDSDNTAIMLDNLTDSRVSGFLIRDDREDSSSKKFEVRDGSGNRIDLEH